MENIHNYMEIIGAFITGVVGPIAYFLFTRYYREMKDKQIDKIKESVIETCVVEDELLTIRDEFDADRVWISQFHNGGNFYPTGKSIQKFSIFYESVRPGIASIAHTFSNIPCSLYPKMFSHLMTKKGIFIPDFEDTELQTFGLSSAAQTAGDKSTYILPLFSLDKKYIGNIGVDYVLKKNKMTKDEWEHFQIYAGRIAGFLSNYLEK
jgi:hypothetical protein